MTEGLREKEGDRKKWKRYGKIEVKKKEGDRCGRERLQELKGRGKGKE